MHWQIPQPVWIDLLVNFKNPLIYLLEIKGFFHYQQKMEGFVFVSLLIDYPDLFTGFFEDIHGIFDVGWFVGGGDCRPQACQSFRDCG